MAYEHSTWEDNGDELFYPATAHEYTTMNHDGQEWYVGELRETDPINGTLPWLRNMNKEKLVFLSHSGQDDESVGNVKLEIAEPTHWFLKKIIGVKAFLDKKDVTIGTDKQEAISKVAYQCTHAIVFLSPAFRTREYCVKELNTFMARRGRGERLKIFPALWRMENLDGYSDEVKEIVWLNGDTSSSVRYIVDYLWPQLAKLFKRDQEMLSDDFYSHQLEIYARSTPGEKPNCLNDFVNGRITQRPALENFRISLECQMWRLIALGSALIAKYNGQNLVRSANPTSGENSCQDNSQYFQDLTKAETEAKFQECSRKWQEVSSTCKELSETLGKASEALKKVKECTSTEVKDQGKPPPDQASPPDQTPKERTLPQTPVFSFEERDGVCPRPREDTSERSTR